MFEKVITTLVDRLGIKSGSGMHYTEDPARQAVIDGLLGRSETSVTLVDTPWTGDRWILLGAVNPELDAQQFPLLVKAHLHKDADPSTSWGCACKEVLPRLQQLGWEGSSDRLTTQEVAGWFVGRAAGLVEDDVARFPTTCAPAAGYSFARIPIGGDLGEVVGNTDDHSFDSNSYDWYDLTDVPVGGSVWRISFTNTLWVFTRRDDDQWEVTVLPNAQCAHTSHYDGGKDFGTLLEGALEALRLVQSDI